MSKEMVWTPADGAGPSGQFHATEALNWLRATNGAGVMGYTFSVSVATMTITFPAFTAWVPTSTGGIVLVSYAGGTVVIAASHATLPRTSIIQLNSSGTLSEKAGTPTAESGDVVEAPMPAIDTNAIALLKVRVGINVSSLSDSVMWGRAIDVSRASGAMTYIRKPTTETVNNSNTLQNDDDFVITTVANTDYLVEVFLLLTGNVTADWKFAWTLTNMTWDGTMDQNITPTTAVTTIQTAQGTASAAAQTIGLATNAAASMLYRAQFVIHSGATGGTLNFQWAQATADVSNTQVLKNSVMRYRALGAS